MYAPGIIEGAAIGLLAGYTASAAISALPVPRNEYSFYSWFYRFSTQMANLLNNYMRQKYHVDADGGRSVETETHNALPTAPDLPKPTAPAEKA